MLHLGQQRARRLAERDGGLDRVLTEVVVRPGEPPRLSTDTRWPMMNPHDFGSSPSGPGGDSWNCLPEFRGPVPVVTTWLHRWLDSWAGIGLIEHGMARQGYDLSLTRFATEGWRATFDVSGLEHSPTPATGSAFEPAPWRAVQAAALSALWIPEGRAP